jgi:DNA-binding transcriptional LysR family regulator
MRRGELADLTAFVAIADHLSFRAAAVRFGVTPSARRHTMRQLKSASACACCSARRAASR